MPVIDSLTWCDRNMDNNYPVVDSATMLSTSGIALPQSFLVDLQIILPQTSSISSTNFFISKLVRDANSVWLEISYMMTGTSVVCATTGAISLSIRNTSVLSERTVSLNPVANSIAGFEALNSISGHVIIGTCLDILDLGTLTFTYDATELISIRIMQYPVGLNSISVTDSNGLEHIISSDFTIQAGDGIDIAVDGTVITISRTATEEEAERDYNSAEEVAAAVLKQLGQPIRYINGVAPNAQGNITVSGGTCVEIKASEGRIQLNNPCSKPCCDDSTISDVRTGMTLLEEAQTRLSQYYEALTVNVNAIQARLASLIASRR